jgi:hypothetical protein
MPTEPEGDALDGIMKGFEGMSKGSPDAKPLGPAPQPAPSEPEGDAPDGIMKGFEGMSKGSQKAEPMGPAPQPAPSEPEGDALDGIMKGFEGMSKGSQKAEPMGPVPKAPQKSLLKPLGIGCGFLIVLSLCVILTIGFPYLEHRLSQTFGGPASRTTTPTIETALIESTPTQWKTMSTAAPTEAPTLPPASIPPQASPSPTKQTDLNLSDQTSSGLYDETINVELDPADHSKYIVMPSTMQLRVDTGKITVSGLAPWVPVSGSLSPDGSFNMSGSGTVAGYPNIKVQFVGNLTANNGLVGDYTMGVGGGLPTNQSITYHVQGQRVKPLATDAVMKIFLNQLGTALRTNDPVYLFNNLDPAVKNLYTAATCQTHFQQRSPDPTYNIVFNSMTGPAAWVYAPAGLAPVSETDVYTVNANVTAQGKTTIDSLHIVQLDDHLTWLTKCK